MRFNACADKNYTMASVHITRVADEKWSIIFRPDFPHGGGQFTLNHLVRIFNAFLYPAVDVFFNFPHSFGLFERIEI